MPEGDSLNAHDVNQGQETTAHSIKFIRTRERRGSVLKATNFGNGIPVDPPLIVTVPDECEYPTNQEHYGALIIGPAGQRVLVAALCEHCRRSAFCPARTDVRFLAKDLSPRQRGYVAQNLGTNLPTGEAPHQHVSPELDPNAGEGETQVPPYIGEGPYAGDRPVFPDEAALQAQYEEAQRKILEEDSGESGSGYEDYVPPDIFLGLS